MKIMILWLLIVSIICSIFRIANIIYNKCIKKKKQEENIDLNLLTSSISYEQYKKVSKESSVQSNLIRTKGDFMDFILESISFDDTGIENRILTLSCGEIYEK